jgi:hypothetical protein
MPDGGVAIGFKMLTYCVYAPLLNPIGALPSTIWSALKAAFSSNTLKSALNHQAGFRSHF